VGHLSAHPENEGGERTAHDHRGCGDSEYPTESLGNERGLRAPLFGHFTGSMPGQKPRGGKYDTDHNKKGPEVEAGRKRSVLNQTAAHEHRQGAPDSLGRGSDRPSATRLPLRAEFNHGSGGRGG
jgi:hypothetical protein